MLVIVTEIWRTSVASDLQGHFRTCYIPNHIIEMRPVAISPLAPTQTYHYLASVLAFP
jgi:hypothetical protein